MFETVTIRPLRSGSQERSYGPHVHAADVIFEGVPKYAQDWEDITWEREALRWAFGTRKPQLDKKWAERLDEEQTYDPSDQASYYRWRLVQIDVKREGETITAYVRAESPFND